MAKKRLKPWEMEKVLADRHKDQPALKIKGKAPPKRKPGSNMLKRPRWEYDQKTGRELPKMREQKSRNRPFYPKFGLGDIDGRHKGALVFIIGSGPSLKQVTPFLPQVNSHITIGMNLSYLFMETNYLVFLDNFPWAHDKKRLLRLKSHLFCTSKAKAPELNVFKQYKPAKLCADAILSDSYTNGLCSGTNTMFSAINLAYVLGAKAIALVGVDLNDATHFWTGDEKYAKNPVLVNRRNYWRNKKGFPGTPRIMQFLAWMKEYLTKRGVACYNCSKNSAVKSWEKVPLPDLLEKYRPGRVEIKPAITFEREEDEDAAL